MKKLYQAITNKYIKYLFTGGVMTVNYFLRSCFFFFMFQIVSLHQADAYINFSNKCIEIDGMYINFDQFASPAYMSPISGGQIVKIDGRCGAESCSVELHTTDEFKRKITIDYIIYHDTKAYIKKVLTLPTNKEKLDEDAALKKGIPYQYKFKMHEDTSGEWKFIECKGRK